MENKSGLVPLGLAVLIKPYEAKKLSTIIHIPDEAAKNMTLLEQKAVVVEVGSSAWHNEPTPRAAAGDHVIVTKFAGYMAVGDDGEQYRLVNDRDIFARVVNHD